MVRTVADRPGRLRFERDEGDGRPDHSPVVLDVAVSPVAGGASVRLDALVGKHVPLVDLGRELRRRGPRAVRRLEGLLRTPPV